MRSRIASATGPGGAQYGVYRTCPDHHRCPPASFCILHNLARSKGGRNRISARPCLTVDCLAQRMVLESDHRHGKMWRISRGILAKPVEPDSCLSNSRQPLAELNQLYAQVVSSAKYSRQNRAWDGRPWTSARNSRWVLSPPPQPALSTSPPFSSPCV